MDKITQELEFAYEMVTKDQNYDEAFTICNRIISENPNIPNGLRKRAAIYARKGDFQNAIVDITGAIKINRNESGYFFFRGWWYFELGDLKQAIEDQTESIKLGNEQGLPYFRENSYFFRAAALIRLGKFEDALGDLQNVRDDFLIYTAVDGELSKKDLVEKVKARINDGEK